MINSSRALVSPEKRFLPSPFVSYSLINWYGSAVTVPTPNPPKRCVANTGNGQVTGRQTGRQASRSTCLYKRAHYLALLIIQPILLGHLPELGDRGGRRGAGGRRGGSSCVLQYIICVPRRRPDVSERRRWYGLILRSAVSTPCSRSFSH